MVYDKKAPKPKSTNIRYIARIQKSENKYFAAARFDMGNDHFSGISELVVVKTKKYPEGKMIPNTRGNRMFWPVSLDDKMMKLMATFGNKGVANETTIPAPVATEPESTIFSSVAEDNAPASGDQGDNLQGA